MMSKMKFKRMVVTVTLIGAFLIFGMGVKNAQSANIDEAAFYALVTVFYVGNAEVSTGYVFEGYSLDYLYEAYSYYVIAAEQAYNSYYYAYNSSAYYAYDAYTAAYNAWLYLLNAADYQYSGWYYDNASYTGLALQNSGIAARYLAYVLYYAAYLS